MGSSGPVSWIPDLEEIDERPYHRIFDALARLPSKWYSILSDSLCAVALSVQRTDQLLPIAAFCAEFAGSTALRVQEIIPNWDSVSETLARLHLSVFHLVYRSERIAQRLDRFVRYFGQHRLFHFCPMFFSASTYYGPLGLYLRYEIVKSKDLPSYEEKLQDLLGSQFSEAVLKTIVEEVIEEQPLFAWDVDVPLAHFLASWEDPRKYLFDWLLLAATDIKQQRKHAFLQALRRIFLKGCDPQKFYAALLLGMKPAQVSQGVLGLPPELYLLVQEYVTKSQRLRRRTRRPTRRQRHSRRQREQ